MDDAATPRQKSSTRDAVAAAVGPVSEGTGADAPGPSSAMVRHTVVVPPGVSMVSVLGPRDELLRVVERGHPHVDVHVRGDEFTLTGAPGEVALVERLLDEMLAVIATGQALTADAVERSIAMLRRSTTERPAEVLTMNILSGAGAASGPRPWARSATSTPSTRTPSPSASARPAPARPTWRWPRPCRRCRPRP